MEKYKYNTTEDYFGINVEEYFEQIINDDINILNEFEYFQLFFSDDMISFLSDESNNYIRNKLLNEYGSNYKEKIKANKKYNTYEYLYVTKCISNLDILAFIAIRIYMGFHKYPSIECYWKNDKLYDNIISKIMSKEYYFLLKYSLHFPIKSNDESTNIDIDKNDPLIKIEIFLEKLCKNFQKYYKLGSNITIDESLLHFTGRNNMKFYIPMKPHKWGFKIHLLCDPNTKYLYNMLFDPGKD